MNMGEHVENRGLVHVTDRAGHTGPLLHELTLQHRPKRDADGRAIRLGPAVTNAYQAARVLARFLAFEATEVFGVLCLTAPRRVIGWHEVSRGSVDTVWAAPRDVFRTALLSNAAALILAHNHPSGEAQPSDADSSRSRALNGPDCPGPSSAMPPHKTLRQQPGTERSQPVLDVSGAR